MNDILITGPACSGKSRRAEAMAESLRTQLDCPVRIQDNLKSTDKLKRLHGVTTIFVAESDIAEKLKKNGVKLCRHIKL
jgi:tRNA uridine 5-carbamoylmethylation protein Kti12